MRILILCIGSRVPAWVTEGFQDYARRLPRECRLELRAFPVGREPGPGNSERRRVSEGQQLLAAVPRDSQVGVLDVRGAQWSSIEVSRKIDTWLSSGRDVALLIGGPDGLSPACLETASFSWSLSSLTFPHALVRLLVAEQLFRGWSILRNHPYHRE